MSGLKCPDVQQWGGGFCDLPEGLLSLRYLFPQLREQ